MPPWTGLVPGQSAHWPFSHLGLWSLLLCLSCLAPCIVPTQYSMCVVQAVFSFLTELFHRLMIHYSTLHCPEHCSRTPRTYLPQEKQGRDHHKDPRRASAENIYLRKGLLFLPANNTPSYSLCSQAPRKSSHYASNLYSIPRKSCRKINSNNNPPKY